MVHRTANLELTIENYGLRHCRDRFVARVNAVVINSKFLVSVFVVRADVFYVNLTICHGLYTSTGLLEPKTITVDIKYVRVVILIFDNGTHSH